MSSILISAVAGGAGGLAGAAVAWVVAKRFGQTPGWLALVPILTAAIAVAMVGPLREDAGDKLMADLDRLVTVRAIKAHDPQDYSRLEARVRRMAASGKSDDAFAPVDDLLGELISRQRPLADAESRLALFQLSLDEGRALQRIDPPGCAQFMDGRGAPPSLEKVMTREMLARDGEVAARFLA